MSGPRILLTDLETVPTLGWFWSLWKVDIPINMIQIPTRVTCFAAKFHGERGVEFYSDFDKDNPRSMFVIGENGLPVLADWVPDAHERMVRQAWRLLDEADAVAYWNGDSFDEPHFQHEFQVYGLGRPSDFFKIDLMKAAKRGRRLSNKLQYVSTEFGLQGKHETGGFGLWLKVMGGDPVAMRKFERYCCRDTVMLGPVLDRLWPWVKNKPNRLLYADHSLEAVREPAVCPDCGRDDETQWRGYNYTKVSRFPKFFCKRCRSWGQDTKRDAGVSTKAAS